MSFYKLKKGEIFREVIFSQQTVNFLKNPNVFLNLLHFKTRIVKSDFRGGFK